MGSPTITDLSGDGRPDLVALAAGGITLFVNRGHALRARTTVPGAAQLMPAARHAQVTVACGGGIGHCYGTVGLGTHRPTRFAVAPGHRSDITVAAPGLQVGDRTVVHLAPDGQARTKRPVMVTQASPTVTAASCRPPDRYLVAASPAATLLLEAEDGQFLTGCLLATGRRVAVDMTYTDGPFATAGNWAATIGRGDCDYSCYWLVWITDLRTGRLRTLVSDDTQPCNATTADCGLESVTKIVAGPHGQAAWAGCLFGVPECEPTALKYVVMLDDRGVRRVATSPDLDPRSLRATGDRFSWVVRGHRNSARWHGAPKRNTSP